jgi:prefoldin alpha subunit
MSNQPNPSPEETVNALVTEVRILESTYNELTSRQNLLERALIESRGALDSIKGLSDGPTKEVLTQIGAGAMLRSEPPATDRVLVSIGANIVIEKSKEEAVAILEERSREVEKTIVSVAGQRNEIAERLNSDREFLNALVSRNQQG